MRRLFVIFAVVLFAIVGVAATPLAGSAPYATDRVVLASITDWNLYEFQSWCRSYVVKNLNDTDPLFVGSYDETGTFDVANDNYTELGPGESFGHTLSESGAVKNSHRYLPLASATASHAAAITCTEAR